MSKIKLLNMINEYSLEGKNEELVDLLNEMFDNGEYKAYLNLIFNAISITQMYGFLAYLTEEERNFFLLWDKVRSDSYSGKRMKFYNKGQLSLLFDLEENNKVFFSAPTSFGKTSLVIEYIIAHHRELNNVLFVVPTNSLLEELFTKMVELNNMNNFDYVVSTRPYFQEGINNFLVLTPERFLMLFEETEVSRFDLIVMDG